MYLRIPLHLSDFDRPSRNSAIKIFEVGEAVVPLARARDARRLITGTAVIRIPGYFCT